MNIRIAIIGFLSTVLVLNTAIAQKAKVKSVEFKELERPEGATPDAELALLRKEYKEFDAGGRMVTYLLHTINPGGQLVKTSEIKKKYEEKLLRMEERSKFDEMGDMILTEKIYFADDKLMDKIEFTDFLKDPNTQYTKQYSYDNNTGEIHKITLYNNKGKKSGDEVYKYNREGEEVKYSKWEMLPNGNKYQETKTTEYNKKDGTLAKSVKTINDGKDALEEVTIFERNKIKEQFKYKNRELISEFGGKNVRFDPSKARVLVDFGNDKGKGGFGMWANEDEYDENGNKIKTTQTVDGVITQVTSYAYDDRNNLTEVKKVNFEEGKETTTDEEQQEFDVNNNMLRKAVYNNGILISEKKYDYQYH